MLKRFNKELSEVCSQIEMVRRSAFSSLTFLSKNEEQIAEMHYVTLLREMKDLRVKLEDLKRHMEEGEDNGLPKP